MTTSEKYEVIDRAVTPRRTLELVQRKSDWVYLVLGAPADPIEFAGIKQAALYFNRAVAREYSL